MILVTGDEATSREAIALLGEGLTTVSVKKGIGRVAARNVAPLRARELIEEGARNALKKVEAVKPVRPGPSVRDRGRVPCSRRGGQVPGPEGGRGHGHAIRRLPGRRLVDGVATAVPRAEAGLLKKLLRVLVALAAGIAGG